MLEYRPAPGTPACSPATRYAPAGLRHTVVLGGTDRSKDSRLENCCNKLGWAAPYRRGWPLAGPVFAHQVQSDGAEVSLQNNRMRVAEAEFVFIMGKTLAPRPIPYTRDEVLEAVQSIHPGIEVPDSRFLNFEEAGAAQLIADCACSNKMVLGAAATTMESLEALASVQTHAAISDGREFSGSGANVLGDPVVALCWLVNELSENQLTCSRAIL